MADPYRLPETVVPSHYDLVLEPDLGAATFAGEVGIDVDATETTSEIVLNAIELERRRGRGRRRSQPRSPTTPSTSGRP